MKTIFIPFLLMTTMVSANELEKEIKYLGNNGIEESHQVVCINGKTGIVTINNETQKMQVKTNASATATNIGRATFSDAEEIICK